MGLQVSALKFGFFWIWGLGLRVWALNVWFSCYRAFEKFSGRTGLRAQVAKGFKLLKTPKSTVALLTVFIKNSINENGEKEP